MIDRLPPLDLQRFGSFPATARNFEPLIGESAAHAAKDAPPNDVSIYARTNLWIIDTARAEAVDPTRIYALLVWDEKSTGDGPGGTSDFQQKICDLGGEVEIINPTKLP